MSSAVGALAAVVVRVRVPATRPRCRSSARPRQQAIAALRLADHAHHRPRLADDDVGPAYPRARYDGDTRLAAAVVQGEDGYLPVAGHRSADLHQPPFVCHSPIASRLKAAVHVQINAPGRAG